MTANHYIMRRLLTGLLCITAALAQNAAAAELGVRVSALHADPNLHGLGLVAHWPLSQGFFLQATLDSLQPERQSGTLSLRFNNMRNVVAGAAIGREHKGPWESQSWFWTWGISAGFPTISRSGADSSEPSLDAATEIHLTAAIGLSRQLSEHWSLTGAARFERHFIDWRLTDSDGTLLSRRKSLSASGLSLSLSYRF